MTYPSSPVRPRTTHESGSGLGDAISNSEKHDPSKQLEVHAADEEGDGDDLFGDEGPEHLGQGETIELQNESEEEDSAPRRTAPDPGEPTAEEVAEHRVDHVPYRSWCSHCVRGRVGTDLAISAADFVW